MIYNGRAAYTIPAQIYSELLYIVNNYWMIS